MKNFKEFRKYLREEEEPESFVDDVMGLDLAVTGDFDGIFDGEPCCQCQGEHAHNNIISQRLSHKHINNNKHMKFLSAKNLNQFKTMKTSTKKANQKRKKNK